MKFKTLCPPCPLWFLLLLLTATSSLFAFGRKEAPEEEEINTEWVLCITAIDSSTLPLTRQLMGDTVSRTLADTLSNLNFRLRGDEEYGYYRDYAWARSRSQAARALETKRNERDLLIYRGDPSWRYRRNLKTVDEAILELEEEMARIDGLVPAVEGKPVFMLSEENIKGNFPQPPKPGEEFRFSTSHKADAFLAGSVSEYHGRIFLDLRMYTLYSRSYSFEYSVLFSSNDFNDVLEEVSSRLALAVSESLSAGILVRAVPDDAMLLINERYADLGIVHALPPGMAEISLRADNHSPFTVPLELNPAELAELFIDLSPFALSSFEADVPDSPGSRVFLGSLYVGETPLTLRLPRNEFSYISVETQEGEVGSVVYRNNAIVRGSAQFAGNDAGGRAVFNTAMPISPEERRVENARQGFYRSYGAFWFILPAALLTAGIAGTYIAADEYVTANNVRMDAETREKLSDSASLGRTATTAAYGIMGASLGISFYQIFRYVRASGGEPTPIAREAER